MTTCDTYAQRMHQHRHNGLLGSIYTIRAYLKNIQCSPTLTHEAVTIADDIACLLRNLEHEVYTYRKELDGTVRTIVHAKK